MPPLKMLRGEMARHRPVADHDLCGVWSGPADPKAHGRTYPTAPDIRRGHGRTI